MRIWPQGCICDPRQPCSLHRFIHLKVLHEHPDLLDLDPNDEVTDRVDNEHADDGDDIERVQHPTSRLPHVHEAPAQRFNKNRLALLFHQIKNRIFNQYVYIYLFVSILVYINQHFFGALDPLLLRRDWNIRLHFKRRGRSPKTWIIMANVWLIIIISIVKIEM